MDQDPSLAADDGLTLDPIPALSADDGLTSDPPAPVHFGLTLDPTPTSAPWAPSFVKTVGLTSDPYVVRDLASEARDEGLPDLPWAAALVEETPCPDNPDLFVLTSSKGRNTRVCAGRGRHARRKADRGARDRLFLHRLPRGPEPAHPAVVRRRVMRRDGFRCQCPDCPHTVWLDLHHLVFWCRGGLSVPANLVLLCRRCHRNLHKGRLRIQGNAERGLTFLDACGRVLGSTTAAQEARAAEFADRLLLCGRAA